MAAMEGIQQTTTVTTSSTVQTAADEGLLLGDTVMEVVRDVVRVLGEEAVPPVQPFRLNDLPRELRDNIWDHALVETTPFRLNSKPTKDTAPGNSNTTEDSNDDSTAGDEDTTMSDALATDPPLDEALGLPASLLSTRTPNATMKFRAATNILLANKQIYEEYSSRAKHHMELILKDHHDYSFQPIPIPPFAKRVRSLQLHLILFCHNCSLSTHVSDETCHAALELRNHRAWIDKLLPQLTELKRLVVTAHICHDMFKVGDQSRAPCEAIVKKKVRETVCMWPRMKRCVVCRYDFAVEKGLEGEKEVCFEWVEGVEREVLVGSGKEGKRRGGKEARVVVEVGEGEADEEGTEGDEEMEEEGEEEDEEEDDEGDGEVEQVEDVRKDGGAA